MEQYKFINPVGLSPEKVVEAHRFNSFGSLYYFIRVPLKRKKLTEHLHLPICRSLEERHMKLLLEIPRDHYKSTICSEGAPMWWALPFMESDEDAFAKLGYSDEFINYMKAVHDPNTRTLLVSETIGNAAKLGSKIRWHFESNDLYRCVFPETLPTSAETWTSFSLCVKRPKTIHTASHGEGTFDFIGVGGALQSRHYNRAIEDDLVGRKAIESPSIMDSTIEYHRLLVGAFESEDANHENTEVVVGNRWDFNDLNSYIREHEPWFRIESHSALGGCCDRHPFTPPFGQPIFPESFSYNKLLQRKQGLGAYQFSCQFLNSPVSPEDADFKESDLNYFELERDYVGRLMVRHETKDGNIERKDLLIGHLSLAMASDPNHSGNAGAGRCRHATVVVGMSSDYNYYLLDCWAKHASYDSYINEGLYGVASKWKLQRFGLETVAAQIYLKYHIDYRNRMSGLPLRIIELKGEVDSPDGTVTRKKEWRIRNVLSPLFESGRFWVQRKHQDFIAEFSTFPKGKFKDILDALAYTPQMLKNPHSAAQHANWRAANYKASKMMNSPYALRSMRVM